MNNVGTYISFVIQNGQQHFHDFIIVELPVTQTSLYGDNTSQEVILWAKQKQETLKDGEKIIILNYFNISNLK